MDEACLCYSDKNIARIFHHSAGINTDQAAVKSRVVFDAIGLQVIEQMCCVPTEMTGLHCCAFTQSTTRSTACHRGSFHFLSDLQGSVCVFGNFEIRDLYYSSLLMCTVCLYILFSFCCMILINRSQNTFRRDKLFSERLGITIFECVKIHSVSPLYFNFTVLY